MASAAPATNNPEELAEMRRQREYFIAQKKQERKQICDSLDKEIDTLKNTCPVTGHKCNFKEMGSGGRNWQQMPQTRFECNDCGKGHVSTKGGKRTRRKSHRRKKRSRRKQKTRRKRRKRRSRKKRRSGKKR
jgi:hypothetical protein|tara:strand:+ start:986 stop:1381 length:396 start_codon:yes stop_codon:yes gene_type:complete